MQTQPLTPTLEYGHNLLSDAVLLACRNHTAQVRKGTSIPYVSHLLQVAGLVLEHGGSLEQAAAGVLHDVVEDTELGMKSLRLIMGKEVAAIVEACTDTFEGDAPGTKAPWMERKSRYLAGLSQASPEAALVIACDKLHNLRCQISDIRHSAAGCTVEFNAPFADRRWLQAQTLEALRSKLPPKLLSELEAATKEWTDLHAAADHRARERE